MRNAFCNRDCFILLSTLSVSVVKQAISASLCLNDIENERFYKNSGFYSVHLKKTKLGNKKKISQLREITCSSN